MLKACGNHADEGLKQGLTQNVHRRASDPEKVNKAAAQYLRSSATCSTRLASRMASYNGGTGRVQREMRRSGKTIYGVTSRHATCRAKPASTGR